MTPSTALIIKLMDAYSILDYTLTRPRSPETRILPPVIRRTAPPELRGGTYGPCAANLNKVLEVMEGHFIRGCGDPQKPDAEIELLPGAVEESTAFVAAKAESLARLNRVAPLIEGFETPYGIELLATVHWVRQRGGPGAPAPAANIADAVTQIHAWNPRKQQVFRPHHIATAWRQLDHQGWANQ
jgi:hypothetical protein